MIREFLRRFSPQTIGQALANALAMVTSTPSGPGWTLVERTKEENRVRLSFALKINQACLNGDFARWAIDNADTLHEQSSDQQWQSVLAFCEVPPHLRYCVPEDAHVLLALAQCIAP